jgi:ElaB/YqjD/DUF883 family membrane-anchored ribosome-binding protein
MFNSSKTQEVKENVNEVVNTAKENFDELSLDAKLAASKIGGKVKEAANQTKDEANQLLTSLRALLSDSLSDEQTKAEQIKAELAKQYHHWRIAAQDELAELVAQSRVKSRKVLHDQPLLSLAVAVGAGALIGYVVGQHQSTTRD